MKHLGDFDTSAVIYGKFTTYRPSTGATYTLAGTPALSVYKDNSTTQSTTGVTLTADFDSVTGLNHFAIDTSADGTFYAAGSFFDIVITTGTVDSVSVTGAVVGSFTLRKNSALKPATAGRTVVVDANGLVDANTVKLGPSGSGTAQTARDIGTSVLLSAGTGTGQLDFTSGVVKANLAQILGTALTETAGQIAAGFKQFFNIASPTSTMNTITTVTTTTTATNLTNAPTNGDLTATMKTSVTTAATAATPTVTISSGTGAGQLDITSGVVKANLVQILGTALTETAGQLAGGFKKFFNIPTPASTMDALTLVATATNLTNAPTNGDLTATMKASVTTAATAATPTAAAVTGAVGSVTGNVGGNVAGSVGSVTAAVSVTGDLSATMKTSVTTACTASTPTAAAVTGNVGGNVVGSVASVTAGVTVTTNNDKTGYGLSAAAVQAVWDALTTALTTAGSIGKRLVDNITGDAFVRLGAPAGASVSADIAAIQSDTDNLQSRIPAALVGGKMPSTGVASYDGGAVHYNTDAGNTNTVSYVDGTADNPVSTLAAAKTIALAVKLYKIKVSAWSVFNPVTGLDGFIVEGDIYQPNISTVTFDATATDEVTWVGHVLGWDASANNVGPNTQYAYCVLGAATGGITNGRYMNCEFTNDLPLRNAASKDYFFHNCYSYISTPLSITFPAQSSVNVIMVGCMGNYKVINLTDSDSIFYFEGTGVLEIDSSCTAGTIIVMGNVQVINNGSATLSVDANTAQAEIQALISQELNTTTYAEPTGVPGATVSLSEKIGRLYQALRNKVVVDSSGNTKTYYDDGGSTLWKKALTDDGTSFTEDEGTTP